MTPRFYAYLWIIYALAAATCFVTGTLTMMALVIFGFIAFGLIFAGMMCVLPAQVAHEHEETSNPVPAKPRLTVEKQSSRLTTAEVSLR
ncbi:MAG: hypothetical protein JO314_12355 [Acidobacteria bacterium]|nr:hypothetical protein [Acidobacteriota bacterium]